MFKPADGSMAMMGAIVFVLVATLVVHYFMPDFGFPGQP